MKKQKSEEAASDSPAALRAAGESEAKGVEGGSLFVESVVEKIAQHAYCDRLQKCDRFLWQLKDDGADINQCADCKEWFPAIGMNWFCCCYNRYEAHCGCIAEPDKKCSSCHYELCWRCDTDSGKCKPCERFMNI